MNTAKLISATPDGDKLIGYLARVSNPKADPNDDASRLISYLIRHKHWSPFEMAHALVEIETTRDISRQILRHGSFRFQEFSGRYAVYEEVGKELRECRLQDHTNRQSSLPCDDRTVDSEWRAAQQAVVELTTKVYHEALEMGIAKEQARAVLPEGLTPTKLYMVGSIRSWIHYWGVRTDPSTQKEHRDVAKATFDAIVPKFPSVYEALKNLQ